MDCEGEISWQMLQLQAYNFYDEPKKPSQKMCDTTFCGGMAPLKALSYTLIFRHCPLADKQRLQKVVLLGLLIDSHFIKKLPSLNPRVLE